jgi:eukaryotic-like serine/threonine-protein kinase
VKTAAISNRDPRADVHHPRDQVLVATLPAQIGKYEIIRLLGRGGMGTVYLARDPQLDRSVAIKILRDPLFDEELLQRFFREARAAANLRHDNIITIYDVGHHDRQPFMAMEYVDGRTLGDVIRQREPLPLGQKLSFLEQICAGLHHAHREGIVHRDIKPANLMLDRRAVIRIVDFGIARTQGSGMTMDGAMIGTLSYMSPEQMVGRPIDFRSDIFAVGAVAYELLSFQQAFPGTLEDGLLQRLPHEDPPRLSDVCPGMPDSLEQIVLRALAKRPDDRFADLEDFRVALREVRRQAAPTLQLEPLAAPTLPLQRGARPTPTPASTAERRELLARRARQIAVHRDAARAALTNQDLDRAAAACEDALTLDPDDRDALQLRDEIQQAQANDEQASRERRDRERTVRQRIADADLRFSRGDVTGAAAMLHQALAIDATNAAALAMLSRIQPRPPSAARRRVAAFLLAIAGAGIGGALWIASNGDPEPVPAPAVMPSASVAIADPAPAPVIQIAPSPAVPPKNDVAAPAAPAAVDANRKPIALAPATAPAAVVDRATATNRPTQPTPPIVATTPPPERAPSDVVVSAPPPVPPPAPLAAPAPAPSPAVPNVAPPATVATPAPVVPSLLDRERPGILQALNRYQSAYRERSVKSLSAVYPSLPRETRQALDRAFSRDCRDYDVTFGNMQLALNADDPTYATVTVRTIYTCQPKTAQAARPEAVQELFVLRKLGDGWLIDSAGTMDSARR